MFDDTAILSRTSGLPPVFCPHTAHTVHACVLISKVTFPPASTHAHVHVRVCFCTVHFNMYVHVYLRTSKSLRVFIDLRSKVKLNLLFLGFPCSSFYIQPCQVWLFFFFLSFTKLLEFGFAT